MAEQFHTVPAAQPLEWLPRAETHIAEMNISKENVEAIVRNPAAVEMDPTSAEREWPTERRRRGDVITVVAFPPDRPPQVWGVYMVNKDYRPPRGARSGGGGAGNHVPTTGRDLRRRLIGAGFTIEPGGSGHDRVLDPDGKFFYSLAVTPSDQRSFINAWSVIRRKALERGIEL